MRKMLLAGAAALVFAGSSLAYAQQRPGASEGQRGPQQLTAQDASAFTEARLAALRAGLMLTPEQEKNWPAFEQAYREHAKLRRDLREERRSEQRTDDPIERMQRAADALTRRGAALKRLADAAGPLYQSLDEAQKRRAMLLVRAMGLRMGQSDHGHERHHMGMGHGMGGMGMMGPRMGGRDDGDRRRGPGGMGSDDRDWHGRFGHDGRRGMGPGPRWSQDERL